MQHQRFQLGQQPFALLLRQGVSTRRTWPDLGRPDEAETYRIRIVHGFEQAVQHRGVGDGPGPGPPSAGRFPTDGTTGLVSTGLAGHTERAEILSAASTTTSMAGSSSRLCKAEHLLLPLIAASSWIARLGCQRLARLPHAPAARPFPAISAGRTPRGVGDTAQPPAPPPAAPRRCCPASIQQRTAASPRQADGSHPATAAFSSCSSRGRPRGPRVLLIERAASR